MQFQNITLKSQFINQSLMYYLQELQRYIKESVGLIAAGYIGIRFHYTRTLLLALLKIKRAKKTFDIQIDNQTIRIPNNFVAVLMIGEIFAHKAYERLKGLNHILDLGGYVGDSAIYLAQHNKQVTMVESDANHFKLAQYNTKHIPKVELNHGAIVASDAKSIYLVGDNEYRGTVQSEVAKYDPSQVTEIPAIHIKTLEAKYDFDGIKMDIEGGEYEIIRYRLVSDHFTYKKGFIEFHFWDSSREQQLEEMKTFVHFLSSKKYFYHLFDNSGNQIPMVDFINHMNYIAQTTQYINIYFEQDLSYSEGHTP